MLCQFSFLSDKIIKQKENKLFMAIGVLSLLGIGKMNNYYFLIPCTDNLKKILSYCFLDETDKLLKNKEKK